ncbi:MAG: hypothetical protein FWH01_14055 [Oscillospiraceae bacterium]|nr:hypothetical protein [Oscillospiraceae bacterium]
MMKQISKKFKKVTSAALAMALGIGMALPTLALPDGWYAKDETDVVEIVVTKNLMMPINTHVPTINFDFDFTALEVEGSREAADVAKMPSIDSVSVSFTSADQKDVKIVQDAQNNDTGVQYVMKESENIFGQTINWPHAGLYMYSAVENQTVALPGEGKGDIDEILILSEAEYRMEILVAEKSDKTGYYIAGIAIRIIKGDEGEAANGKVDGRPGGPDGDDGFSEFRFRNIYVKNNGKTDPEEPEVIDEFTMLDINKTVKGELASTDKLFDFLVTVHKAEIGVKDTLKYRAYVLNKLENGDYAIADIGFTPEGGTLKQDGKNNDYIEFSTGSEVKVKLTHNQRLAFTDLPVGTSFTVTEKGALNYLPSYNLTIDGEGPVNNKGEYNTDLTVPQKYIGEDENSVAFLNAYNEGPTTGITVDNMPYIVMIALAMFALAGFTAVKYRRGLKFQA